MTLTNWLKKKYATTNSNTYDNNYTLVSTICLKEKKN